MILQVTTKRIGQSQDPGEWLPTGRRELGQKRALTVGEGPGHPSVLIPHMIVGYLRI